LALRDDAGRQMRDTHGRIRRVDVLAALASGAVDVDPQILGPDLHFDIAFKFRDYINGCERRMTPLVGVERRYPTRR
jgi:hypothetical protein